MPSHYNIGSSIGNVLLGFSDLAARSQARRDLLRENALRREENMLRYRMDERARQQERDMAYNMQSLSLAERASERAQQDEENAFKRLTTSLEFQLKVAESNRENAREAFKLNIMKQKAELELEQMSAETFLLQKERVLPVIVSQLGELGGKYAYDKDAFSYVKEVEAIKSNPQLGKFFYYLPPDTIRDYSVLKGIVEDVIDPETISDAGRMDLDSIFKKGNEVNFSNGLDWAEWQALNYFQEKSGSTKLPRNDYARAIEKTFIPWLREEAKRAPDLFGSLYSQLTPENPEHLSNIRKLKDNHKRGTSRALKTKEDLNSLMFNMRTIETEKAALLQVNPMAFSPATAEGRENIRLEKVHRNNAFYAAHGVRPETLDADPNLTTPKAMIEAFEDKIRKPYSKTELSFGRSVGRLAEGVQNIGDYLSYGISPGKTYDDYQRIFEDSYKLLVNDPQPFYVTELAIAHQNAVKAMKSKVPKGYWSQIDDLTRLRDLLPEDLLRNWDDKVLDTMRTLQADGGLEGVDIPGNMLRGTGSMFVNTRQQAPTQTQPQQTPNTGSNTDLWGNTGTNP